MAFPLWFSPPDRHDNRPPRRRLSVLQDDPESPTTTENHLDAALVARIRSGDETAFTELFHTYYPKLVGYAGSLLANADEADDLVCELFAQIFVAHEKFSPQGPVRAYLFRSIRNRVLNIQRSHHSAERYVSEIGEQERKLENSAQERVLRPGDNPMILSAIEDAFVRLPSRAREAASLRWRQGMSLDEIATTLGIAKPSVTMLLSRTLKTLRQELAPLRAYLRDE